MYSRVTVNSRDNATGTSNAQVPQEGTGIGHGRYDDGNMAYVKHHVWSRKLPLGVDVCEMSTSI